MLIFIYSLQINAERVVMLNESEMKRLSKHSNVLFTFLSSHYEIAKLYPKIFKIRIPQLKEYRKNEHLSDISQRIIDLVRGKKRVKEVAIAELSDNTEPADQIQSESQLADQAAQNEPTQPTDQALQSEEAQPADQALQNEEIQPADQAVQNEEIQPADQALQSETQPEENAVEQNPGSPSVPLESEQHIPEPVENELSYNVCISCSPDKETDMKALQQDLETAGKKPGLTVDDQKLLETLFQVTQQQFVPTLTDQLRM